MTLKDTVDGTIVMLNDNAGWCWYQDERVVFDPDAKLLLTSTIANAGGHDGVAREADVDLTAFDLRSGNRNRATMAKCNSYDSGDDHNVGAIWIRPDRRYLHMWTGHNEATRNAFYRLSVRPGDLSEWESLQYLNWVDIGNPDTGKHSTTYSNLHFLTDENEARGRLYNFSRESQRSPNIAYSDDHGATWHYGGKLTLPKSDSSYSNGYTKFASNGKDRIDFVSTEHHPRDFNTSIFHGYIQGGKSFDSFGEVVDENIFDEVAPAPQDFTPVFRSPPEDGEHDDVEFHRAWTVELELDSLGNPRTLFTTRYGTQVSHRTAGEADHRLFYGSLGGNAWCTHEVAKMGGPLWKNEEDYTGLAAIYPGQPNVIYVSTNIDPRNDDFREIYRGETIDDGESWNWVSITSNSTLDNLRPAIPRGFEEGAAVCWLRGTYFSQSHFDQSLVAIFDSQNTKKLGVEFHPATSSNCRVLHPGWTWNGSVGPNGSFVLSDEFAADPTALVNDRLTARMPELEMTVELGPQVGTDVLLYFWLRDGEDGWLQASVDGQASINLSRRGAQAAQGNPLGPDASARTEDRQLYQAYLGRMRAHPESRQVSIHVSAVQPSGWVSFAGFGLRTVHPAPE
ncbi:MAG: BNR-4 repeat-containing protein [Planctomycetales bacterium]|nr:BNR-4 repeat-containing protein [Planctomycetales bacterium]